MIYGRTIVFFCRVRKDYVHFISNIIIVLLHQKIHIIRVLNLVTIYFTFV